MCDCPRGSVPAYHCQLMEVTVQALGCSFILSPPHPKQPGLLICDTAVRAPKTVSWLLDLRAGALSCSPSISSCAPSRACDLTRDGEVMARSAQQASWHDPRQWSYSVQRGQPAHSVRKHFSLLIDDCWAGWIQFLASHFPQLLQPSSWGFERRGRSTELITLKNYPHTVCLGNFKPQGHKLSKSQCDSSQIPGRWLLQEKARQNQKLWTWQEIQCSDRKVSETEEPIVKAKSHW